MGSRSSTERPRGRTWRPSAGAASFGFCFGDRAGSADPPPETPPQGGVREPWALRTTDTLRPGERGSRRLAAQFGDRLVCVRYRCDAQSRKRYKTVELIVAESDWDPPPGPDDLVQVRVAFGEEELRRKVKGAGGRWRPERKTWELLLKTVKELGLTNRVVASGS